MMSSIQRLDIPWIEQSFKENGKTVEIGESIEIEKKNADKILDDLQALDVTEITLLKEDVYEFTNICNEAINESRIK